MKEYIKKIFESQPDVYQFRIEEDKEKVIAELSRRYELRGNTVVNSKTGGEIEPDLLEAALFNASSPFLRVLGRGKYVPKFIDNRNTDAKLKQKSEVEKVVNFLFEKNGYVFKNEHLGDTTLRDIARASIAENFLFEAGTGDGDLVFRKFSNGIFSTKQFTPEEIINHYTNGLIDHHRTNEKKSELLSEIKAKEAAKMGYSNFAAIPKDYQEKFNAKAMDAFKASQKVYTKKVLPRQEEQEVKEEFKRRAIFKTGLPSEEAATLSQRKAIDSYQAAKMNDINSLPSVQGIKEYQTPVEQWEINTENKTGYSMPPDML
jgi:hypothetical protein